MLERKAEAKYPCLHSDWTITFLKTTSGEEWLMLISVTGKDFGSREGSYNMLTGPGTAPHCLHLGCNLVLTLMPSVQKGRHYSYRPTGSCTLPTLLSTLYSHWPSPWFLNTLLWFLPQGLCNGHCFCRMLFPWLRSSISNIRKKSRGQILSYSAQLKCHLLEETFTAHFWRDTALTLSLLHNILLYYLVCLWRLFHSRESLLYLFVYYLCSK